MSFEWGEKWPLYMKIGIIAAFVFLLLIIRPDRTLNIPTVGERPNSLTTLSDPVGDLSTQPAEKEPPMLSEGLKNAIQTVNAGSLLTVRVYLRGLDNTALDHKLLAETGMNAAIYSNPNRFYTEIVPEIEREIEQRLGYEAAHNPIPDDGSDNVEIGLSPIDKAVIDAMADYLAAKRAIVKIEYTALIESFIADRFYDKPREHFRHIDHYLGILIVEADTETILGMVDDLRVRNMTLYTEPEATQ